MADMIDHLHHGPVDRIIEHVLDEAAVDLEEVDRQVLQVSERRHPGAKVIQRETTAQSLELVDKANGAAEVGYCAGFSDLETDQVRRNGKLAKQTLQVLKEFVVADTAARQIDCAHGQRAFPTLIEALADDREHTAHHPAIQRGH
ncbi:hypothetical protein D3C80_1678250 [compost metagenome]